MLIERRRRPINGSSVVAGSLLLGHYAAVVVVAIVVVEEVAQNNAYQGDCLDKETVSTTTIVGVSRLTSREDDLCAHKSSRRDANDVDVDFRLDSSALLSQFLVGGHREGPEYTARTAETTMSTTTRKTLETSAQFAVQTSDCEAVFLALRGRRRRRFWQDSPGKLEPPRALQRIRRCRFSCLEIRQTNQIARREDSCLACDFKRKRTTLKTTTTTTPKAC